MHGKAVATFAEEVVAKEGIAGTIRQHNHAEARVDWDEVLLRRGRRRRVAREKGSRGAWDRPCSGCKVGMIVDSDNATSISEQHLGILNEPLENAYDFQGSLV